MKKKDMSKLNLQAAKSDCTDEEETFRSELIEAQEKIALLQTECDELNAMKLANIEGQDETSTSIVTEPDLDNIAERVCICYLYMYLY